MRVSRRSASTPARPASTATRQATVPAASPPSTTSCQSTRRRRAGGSHQRRSWAHGPIHDCTAPPPPGSWLHSRRAGAAEWSPRRGDDDGAAAAVEERGRERGREDACGVRRRHRTGPAGDLVAVDVVLGRARLAPRHPAHLLGRSAAALRDGGRDRVVAEHALHAGEGAVGAVVRGLVATPEPELAAVARGRLRRGRGARARARRWWSRARRRRTRRDPVRRARHLRPRARRAALA